MPDQLTYSERMDLVKQHHPHVRTVFLPGENVFVLFDRDLSSDDAVPQRLSGKHAWQSQCWYEASERILIEKEREELARDGRQVKVVGAVGYGELQ